MKKDERLLTLGVNVVDACNAIIELEGETMARKRDTLQRSLDFITARRDQCWPENDAPEDNEDLL
jgi:hypothetical protein